MLQHCISWGRYLRRICYICISFKYCVKVHFKDNNAIEDLSINSLIYISGCVVAYEIAYRYPHYLVIVFIKVLLTNICIYRKKLIYFPKNPWLKGAIYKTNISFIEWFLKILCVGTYLELKYLRQCFLRIGQGWFI